MNVQHSHAAFSPGRLGWTGSRDLYVSDTQLCDAQNTGSLRRASCLLCAGYADSSSPYGAVGTTYRLLIRQ
ncbi:unnamed protein product [Lasius platythorax]|uniref:Uncharacterized protein n=1 Tax=Lasius platythorax TaxID=488582 RepID=A0AAV2NFG6_9HYME